MANNCFPASFSVDIENVRMGGIVRGVMSYTRSAYLQLLELLCLGGHCCLPCRRASVCGLPWCRVALWLKIDGCCCRSVVVVIVDVTSWLPLNQRLLLEPGGWSMMKILLAPSDYACTWLYKQSLRNTVVHDKTLCDMIMLICNKHLCSFVQ